ncbi:hypothetical protein BB560_003607 [Smittium megazygosporum]|uniref:THO complex subunitTHOC2 C-terminal domain-containing protein n=1 Tax=Smittium megazygosporum TaxID=133381 RepID=A0A2T9ZBJ8_9FUNG|nr:hypothetical protein BB560_003607 [Smittium megazygosporum]
MGGILPDRSSTSFPNNLVTSKIEYSVSRTDSNHRSPKQQTGPGFEPRKVFELNIEVLGLDGDLVDCCESILLDSTTKEVFITEFYVTFWVLDLYDINMESPYWFFMSSDSRNEVVDHLFDHCISPRAISGAAGAVYTTSFILLIQLPLSAQKFPTLVLLEKIFSPSLYKVLETSKECIGDRDCHVFARKWLVTPGIPIFKNDFKCNIERMLLHEDFIKIHGKWHNILHGLFKKAIISNDPNISRKAFLELKSMVDEIKLPNPKASGENQTEVSKSRNSETGF